MRAIMRRTAWRGRFLPSGYTENVLARRLDELLAQTDPFDLAQALERRVRSLSAEQIHGLIHDALPRMSEYYEHEFLRVNAVEDEASLRSAFAQLLKSNLRAVPLFGPAFGESVLALTPAERTVGFSDEPQQRRSRIVAGTVVTAALVAAAFAGGKYVTEARMQAASATAAPMAAVPLPQVTAASRAAPPARRHAPGRRRATPQPPAATPVPIPAAVAAAQQTQRPAAAQSVPVPTPRTRPRPKRTPAPPEAHGEAVVAVPQAKPHDVDTVQSNGIDTSDMPQPYTDATPLPGESPAAVAEPRGSRVNAPTPAPRRGWLHRTIMHLDPFKPHPQETP
jgi:hypothetical protein